MKEPFTSINLNTLAYIIALVLVTGCELNSGKSVEPQDKSVSGNASARKAGGTINSIPPGGCPDGYVWDNVKGQCVRPAPAYPDVSPSSITFNSSQAYSQPYQQGSSLTVLITPGSTVNGVAYHKAELFKDGIPLNDRLIIGMKREGTTTTYYSNYHDINGKYIGKLTVNNNNQFGSFSKGYSGEAGGAGWTSRGFIGNWAKCVGQTLSTMTSGTALGTLGGGLCMVWAVQCAGTIGLACVAATVLS
jgi:hypothetical protein